MEDPIPDLLQTFDVLDEDTQDLLSTIVLETGDHFYEES